MNLFSRDAQGSAVTFRAKRKRAPPRVAAKQRESLHKRQNPIVHFGEVILVLTGQSRIVLV